MRDAEMPTAGQEDAPTYPLTPRSFLQRILEQLAPDWNPAALEAHLKDSSFGSIVRILRELDRAVEEPPTRISLHVECEGRHVRLKLETCKSVVFTHNAQEVADAIEAISYAAVDAWLPDWVRGGVAR